MGDQPVQRAYDTVAEDYAALLRDELDRKPLDRAMLAAFAEQVQAQAMPAVHATPAAQPAQAVPAVQPVQARLAVPAVAAVSTVPAVQAAREGGGGRVADVGCGPGRITAHLHELGLDAFGIDLSPAMIGVARRSHPHLRFAVGSMTHLALGDAGLDGVLAWYSIIHFPPERLPGVVAELLRVLAPGGWLLLAFQAGDELVHLEQAYGHEISLDAYRLPPDRIAALVEQAGATVEARLVRAAGPREKTPQAFILARKASVPCS